MSKKLELTAENLKNQLWENVLLVKSKNLSPQEANAIASQSREIIRIVRTQMVMDQMKKPSNKLLLK